MIRFALLASPFLGVSVWEPVAELLRAAGHDVVLAGGGDSVESVRAGYLTAIAGGEPVVVVAHSNAGNFVPAIVAERSVERIVLVDAVLPIAEGAQPIAPPELVDTIAPMADSDGLLPPWTDWFEGIAALFPDAETRASIEATEPRMPLAYLRSTLTVPSWRHVPGAYVAFGTTYAREQAAARALGWPVVVLDGLHLHMLVDPGAVVTAIEAVIATTSGVTD